MTSNLSTISIARLLQRQELFYFTARMLADLLKLDVARVYRLLRRLRAHGLVAEVENGKYLLLGLEPERVLANPLFIASHLVTPGYVSYWSALHAYGFTEQVPLTIYVATTKEKRPVEFEGQRYRFVRVRPRKFFGYRREIIGGLPVLIADEAKAIIDSLSELRYAGGVGEVAKALRAALPTTDVATLVEYANRMGDKTLGSRLGYLLGLLGISVEPKGGASDTQSVQGTPHLIRSASPVKLAANRPASNAYDRRWRVNVNLPEAQLVAEGIG
ncbi:MAG: type IV toxin-antitoxin system AbiEi family antitoxin domain-containing protein [Dehalococcoidia bacterium]